MGVYLGGQSVGPIITVVSDEDVVNTNLMRILDLVDANLHGGVIVSDEEYIAAEEEFQILAQKIIGGINE